MDTCDQLLNGLHAHFQDVEVKKRLTLLATKDRQVEGYFKAEMMVVLNGLDWNWWPEVTYPNDNNRKKCDFVVRRQNGGGLIGIELKALFVGKQYKRSIGITGRGVQEDSRGQYHLQSYANTLYNDLDRLSSLVGFIERYSIAFALGNRAELQDNNVNELANKLTERIACSLATKPLVDLRTSLGFRIAIFEFVKNRK